MDTELQGKHVLVTGASGGIGRAVALAFAAEGAHVAAHYHQSEERAQETYGRYPVLQTEDIADMVLYALSRPAHVQIHDLLVRPREQRS